MFYNYFWKYCFTENILIKNKTTQNLLNEFFRWVENFDWYNHRLPPHQCSKSEFASNRPKEDNASAKCFAVFSTIYGQFRCSWQHWCHFVAQTTESADIGATFFRRCNLLLFHASLISYTPRLLHIFFLFLPFTDLHIFYLKGT